MKRHLSFISVIVASGLLFSCKNSVELMKRHYGSGYYLSVNKGAKHKTPEQEKSEKIVNTEIKKVLTSVVKENSIVQTVHENDVITASTTKIPSTLMHKRIVVPTSFDLQATKKTIVERSLSSSKQNHKTALKSLKGGGTDNEIVLAILCIFIPPLAVFLKEDSIGTHFWIDLILCILFWLPGVIFAFLVCFDII